MLVKIIGTIIGAMVLGAGLYYLITEKDDPESKKIYGTVSIIGGIVFVVMMIFTILELL